jgi:hypothetical protein
MKTKLTRAPLLAAATTAFACAELAKIDLAAIAGQASGPPSEETVAAGLLRRVFAGQGA